MRTSVEEDLELDFFSTFRGREFLERLENLEKTVKLLSRIACSSLTFLEKTGQLDKFIANSSFGKESCSKKGLVDWFNHHRWAEHEIDVQEKIDSMSLEERNSAKENVLANLSIEERILLTGRV